MKKFLLQILVFGILIAATLVAGEFAVRRVPNPYRLKDCGMTEVAPVVNTVILGNSHAFYGIRPDMMPGRAFNLANVSQTLHYDLMLLQRYAPLFTDSLRNVILPISYTSFFDAELEDSDEWWRAINYKLYMGIDRNSDLSPYNAELSHISVWNKKLAVAAGLSDVRLDVDPSGFGLAYRTDAKDAAWESTGPATAARHTRGLHTERVEANTAVLDSIADFCDVRGVRLIMTIMPAWHTYTSALDPLRLGQMRRTAAEVAARHPDAVFLDFLDCPDFTADDFYDADHLTSDSGAVRFTRLLLPYLAR